MVFYLSINEFRKIEFYKPIYNKGFPQILKKNLIADIETPFSSLLKISKSEKYSFLLESVEGGSKRGRYSLLGCDPDLIWTVEKGKAKIKYLDNNCLLYTSPSPRDGSISRMPSSA